MTIFVGSSEITDIKIGSTVINSVYVGANKVWDRVTSLDTQTVTVGTASSSPLTWWGYANTGFSHGSVTDGTCNFFNGSAYSAIDSFTTSSTPNYGYTTLLYIVGSHPNSGWTTMTIDGVAFNRTDASFSQASTTSWSWTSATTTSPFGSTVGATKQAVFT
jgi:hypothetical protein|tara:strand:+ start:252 stop:734 length:483 start_codon:yes stop_codon:yes gene_type:complete